MIARCSPQTIFDWKSVSKENQEVHRLVVSMKPKLNESYILLDGDKKKKDSVLDQTIYHSTIAEPRFSVSSNIQGLDLSIKIRIS